MLKNLFFVFVLFFSFSAKSQMADTIGAMGIQGELTTEGYEAINQGQQAFSRMKFQQDLGEVVAEIQTTYFGNYVGINKSAIMYDGFRGMIWDVKEDGEGGFFLEFNGLDGPTCFITKSNPAGAKKTEINSGADCMASGNNVKIFYN